MVEAKTKKKSATKKTVAPKKSAKINKKKVVKKKTQIKEVKLGKVIPEPTITIEHEKIKEDEKLITGVCKKISDSMGIDIKIIRTLFIISSVLIIGIPIYLILSLILRD